MGYELYRHVLNHAPDEIDAAARLVLAVIADDAHEKTRKSYLGMDLLSHRTGLLPDAVGKALRRLAKAGIEIRVPVGTDKRGKPVFAMKGHRTTYLIPVFPERFMAPKDCPQADLSKEQSPDERQTIDDSKVGPEAAKVCLQAAKVGPQADPPPQSPQSPHIGGATEDSDNLFPDLEETKPEPKKPKTTKRATPAPEIFEITPQLREWAKTTVPTVDVDFETQKFLNHHGAKGNTFKDWSKAWRNWMLNATKYAPQHLRAVSGGAPYAPQRSTRNEWMANR